MRKVMKGICWLVFLAFIGLSSFANWEHGTTRISSFMLAVVPVGFAASIFILEGIVAAGKASRWAYAGIIFVASAAGVASYLGLYGMARDSGIPVVQSALLPLAFDGVVAVASMGIRAFSLSHVPAAPRTPRRKAVSAPQDTVSQPTEARVPATEPVSRAAVPADGQRDKAFAMIDEGRDKKDVAETVGVSVRTLNRWLSQRQ